MRSTFPHPVPGCRCHCWMILISLSASAVLAEVPSVSYIFPAGGQRGTTVAFRIGGHNLLGSASLDLRGTGLSASERIVEVPTTWFEGPLVVKPESQAAENYPRDHAGEVIIAADAPLGEASWRVWTSQGATASRPFVIGHLPEVIEHEIDGRPIPQIVTLPVTVNGRMFPREDIDMWAFQAEAGQTITCEVTAARIASPLDSHLEVRGPSGERLVENDDRFGADSWVRWTAPTTGIYQVHIWDAEFRGLQDFVYRLTITAGPVVDHVFPLGGRRGETVQMKLAGQNVPSELVDVTLPNDGAGLTPIQIRLGEQLTNQVLVDVGDLPEVVEPYSNSQSPSTTDKSFSPLPLPVQLNGCIRAPGEVDTWTFRATSAEVVEFQLVASRLGSPLDAVVTIYDAERKTLLQTGSTLDNRVEPVGKLTIPADGVYTLEVRDVFDSRGGNSFGYRLRLGLQSPPDFQLNLASDALTLSRGGEAKLKVIAQRSGGFAGDIKLQFRGLPQGVTVAKETIAGAKADTEVVFKADAKAPVVRAFVTVEGIAQRGAAMLVRIASAMGPPTVSRDSLLLAVAMPTPFQFDGGELQLRYGARGTIFRRKYAVVRNGYSGPLTIQLADRQIRHLQGVKGPTLEVGPEATEFIYSIQLPTGLETNRTGRIILMAIGEVADEEGKKHRVSFSSGETRNQIALLTAPCPLSIRAERSSLLAMSGTTRELTVFVSRGTLSPTPVTVELVPQGHVQGVSAQAVDIPADQQSGVLRVHFAEQSGPFTMPLVLRATSMQNGDPVIAETRIEFVAPPTVATGSSTSQAGVASGGRQAADESR